MMKRFITILGILIFAGIVAAQELMLSGTQQSKIEYNLEQAITPFKGIDVLMVSFVVPADFNSPTYTQNISNLKFNFTPSPNEQEEETDQRGNLIKKFYWDRPSKLVKCDVGLTAENKVRLSEFQDQSKLPLRKLSANVEIFRQPSALVQSDDPHIRKTARDLTAGAATEMQAVQAVLHYVVDKMRYILVPKQYDALYSYETGRGNCQNYSHLAAALMRAAGIPVRIVNGITLKKAFNVRVGQSEYSFEMAQGRHSWIEVYFPDQGWVPFDPQQTEFFVSNRYLRIEVGVDNDETVQDGLVRWSQTKGSAKQMPTLEEAIECNFRSDLVKLRNEKQLDGPQKLLLSPVLMTVAPQPIAQLQKAPEPKPTPKPKIAPKKLEAEPKPPAEPKKPEADKTTRPAPKKVEQPVKKPGTAKKLEKPSEPQTDYLSLTYEVPFEFGNLEFPQNFDFLYARLVGAESSAKEGELKRNFIVETAEYVTGRDQFAQTFVLEEPILLDQIGLALHNFGGSGSIWLELSEDEGGKPGATAARSRQIPVNRIRNPKGYDWVDFDFSGQGLILSPGRYWFSLSYSGSPIVNWFYSYGKPIGPVDGTRSRLGGTLGWNKILTYEFNYRIVGKGTK